MDQKELDQIIGKKAYYRSNPLDNFKSAKVVWLKHLEGISGNVYIEAVLDNDDRVDVQRLYFESEIA